LALRIVVDTDMGVDDAMAVGWLATQEEGRVDLLGVSAVWGNAAVGDAARNVVGLLRALDRDDVPVVAGAGGPTEGKRSRIGEIVHGPDGMWGANAGADVSRATEDLVAFYRSLRAEGATLLALGPLTNLAAVARADPALLRQFERIVVLGGAKHHGSMTPVSETNFWHDAHAADAVLTAHLPITLVTRDAHRAFALTAADLTALRSAERSVARYLAEPATRYAEATRRFGEALNFPDVAAAAVALDPTVATDVRPALVRVMTEPALGRGQSIIGLSVNERLTMVDGGMAMHALVESMVSSPGLDVRAAVGAALAREADNAHVVLVVDAERVRSEFMYSMTRGGR
jgi:inosine-uridine nucleoside N-ribohydrolase